MSNLETTEAGNAASALDRRILEALGDAPVPLFNHFADVGNVTTGEDDLFSNSLPANTLKTNGDVIRAHYSGIFAAHATATRNLKVYVAGTNVFASTAIGDATASDWTLDVVVIRVSNTVIRTAVSMITSLLGAWDVGTPVLANYQEVTGLDLDSDAQIIKLTGEAAAVGAATDDIIAKTGYGLYIPALDV